MMQPADRNGEFITDFPPHGPLLRELNVVGIGWCSTAEETGLCGHEFQMFAVTLPHGLADDNDRLQRLVRPH